MWEGKVKNWNRSGIGGEGERGKGRKWGGERGNSSRWDGEEKEEMVRSRGERGNRISVKRGVGRWNRIGVGRGRGKEKE